MFSLGLSSIQANTPEAHTNSLNHQVNQAISISPQNISTFLTLCCLAIAANKENKSLKEQFNPTTFIKNFIEVYGTAFFVTLCHELGHAVTGRLLEKSNIDVHIGKTNGSAPLIGLGPISIESLNPFIGYSRGIRSYSKVNSCLILAAGPLSGIVGYYFIKTLKNTVHILTNKQQNLSFSENLKTILKKTFTKTSPLDCFALYNFLSLLIPMTKNGDSTKIWKILGADHECTEKFSEQIGPIIVSMLTALFTLNQMIKE